MADRAKRGLDWERLRKRAETLVHERSSPEHVVPEADILRLIHELEVHQVELEVQGEELRLKNQELRSLLHRYADLYNNAPIGFITLNPRGVILEANYAASEMLGLLRDRLRHRRFSRYLDPQYHATYYRFLHELREIENGIVRGEFRFVKESNEPFWVHLEIVPQKDEKTDRNFLATFVDITQRKEAEEQLKAAYNQLAASQSQFKNLSASLLAAHEEERRRIARELHDSIGQTLAAMKFTIEHTLENQHQERPEKAFSLMARLIPIVQNAMNEVRSIYTGLRPSVLDDLGILATIDWFCRDLGQSFQNLHVGVVKYVEEGDVPEELKIVLFRIVQEALNNAAKHSEADSVDVSIAKRDGAIELTVKDNGAGFDPHCGRNRGGMGLASMRERAELSGGMLSVESTLGMGTCIRAVWKV